MRIFLLLMLSMVSYGAATDFSECKGKEANYYVAKFTKNGTANGWLKAARMHQKFYKDRGSDILVVPMLQYRRDSEGNVTVPTGPGLGVHYDWNFINKNAINSVKFS